jgi:cytochrome c biogenesis protein CcmG, thiol:disulfide interchange protein DsbE
MPNPNLLGPNVRKPPHDSGPSRAAGGARPQWVKRFPAIIFVAMASLFLFALFNADPSKIPSALIGKPVPVFDFPALEGLTKDSAPVPGLAASDLAKNRVTVVNVWASWCAPCATEVPMLVELKKRLGDTADLVGINYKDSTAAAMSFLSRKGNPYSRVGTDTTGRGAIDWGVYGIPETFVVNGKGEIAYKLVGEVTADSMEQKLLPAILAAGSASSTPDGVAAGK